MASALDAFFADVLRAAAYGKEVLDEFEQSVQGGDVAVWSVICPVFSVNLSGLKDSRKVLVGHADARIGFPVLQ